MGHPPFVSLGERFSQMAGHVKGISAAAAAAAAQCRGLTPPQAAS
jgi:hypothetical protein